MLNKTKRRNRKMAILREQLNRITLTKTAKHILEYLKGKKIVRTDTHIDRMRNDMTSLNYITLGTDFTQFFQELAEIKIGSLVDVPKQKGVESVFLWKYDYREVAGFLLNPQSPVNLMEKEMTVHKGIKRKTVFNNREIVKDIPINSVMKSSQERTVIRRSSTEGIVLMTRSISGKMTPVCIKEAEKLIDQLNAIKEHMA